MDSKDLKLGVLSCSMRFAAWMMLAFSLLVSCESSVQVDQVKSNKNGACAASSLTGTSAGTPSNKFCAAATALTWSEASPQSATTSTTIVTAAWTKSSSSLLANQKIQFYTGSACDSVSGDLIDLKSATTQTQTFTAAAGMTYTFKITSLDSKETSLVSDCSGAMVITAASTAVPDTTAPSFVIFSLASASVDYSNTPNVTVKVSENATVTLYSDSACSTAISSATQVTANTSQTIQTNALARASVTKIYGKAVDASAQVSSCSQAGSFAHLMKFADPNPLLGNGFGHSLVELTNGNVVITSPYATVNGVSNAGAVYLFNGSTGALISSLYGSTSGDSIGNNGVYALSSGNFVVVSPNWDCSSSLCPAVGANVVDVGAVTWGSGTTGVSGPVTASNSLVGFTANDQVGLGGVSVLTNGNFVAASRYWDCTAAMCPAIGAAVADVGAVTWGSGTSGVFGHVSSANSLVGSTASDMVGYDRVSLVEGYVVRVLTNGNYIVGSPSWSCSATSCPSIGATVANAGAVTWANGATGISGHISSSNSLVGSSAGDCVGVKITKALTNGNYVVSSPDWSCTATSCPSIGATVFGVGAVTWGNGATGITGHVSASNSLVGSSTMDYLSSDGYYLNQDGLTALSNGNYVVQSPKWDCTATRCPAIGATVSDVGAVTWGNGSTGTTGYVSSSNSLVGSTSGDNAGDYGIAGLTNGNYVVRSTRWDCTAARCPAIGATVTDVGAVTWGNGSTGTSGYISAANSLVGSTTNDQVGYTAVASLTNGNYVVRSGSWDCTATSCPTLASTVADVGAVTWGNGTTGISGHVSASNSLVGSTASDQVGGSYAFTTLTNGNYVVGSYIWDCTPTSCPAIGATVADVGAVTWGNGATGISGHVSAANSLVGTTASDQVSSMGLFPLTNGNFVVASRFWDCTAAMCPAIGATVADVGAVTWGNGTTGISGHVSAANSLVGTTASDQISSGSVVALTNGNFVVRSPLWDCTPNSCPAIGATVTNASASTWGNGTTGITGYVSDSNSLVGSGAAYAISNGNYLIRTPGWDCTATLCPSIGSAVTNVGAVMLANGTTGVTGHISAANSLVGNIAEDKLGDGYINSHNIGSGKVVVRSTQFGGVPLIFIMSGTDVSLGHVPQ